MLHRLMIFAVSWFCSCAIAGETLSQFPRDTKTSQLVVSNVGHPQEKLVLSLSLKCGHAIISENGDCPTVHAPIPGTPVMRITSSGWKSHVAGEHGEQLQVRKSRNWQEPVEPMLLAFERQ